MKVYVAGKNLKRARNVMNLLIQNGHDVAFDWVKDFEDGLEEQHLEKHLKERDGIRNSEALIYLWEHDQESAKYEAGMAMGLGIKVIVSGLHQSWFFKLPEVVQVETDEEIIAALDRRS